MNQQNNMALWIEQIEACRSSGQTVIEWCAANGISKSTYYTRQRKVYEAAAKNTGAFVEIGLDPQVETKGLVATVTAEGIVAAIHSGADEATMAALFRAMKLC